MLRAALGVILLCLPAVGAQAQPVPETTIVSRFPIDTQASAQNQRDLDTAMGRAFSALNGYMVNLLVQNQIETRILDVAVNASLALRRTGAKGYLVEVNVYRQASGVPALAMIFSSSRDPAIVQTRLISKRRPIGRYDLPPIARCLMRTDPYFSGSRRMALASKSVSYPPPCGSS